jgi:hypothetical protein
MSWCDLSGLRFGKVTVENMAGSTTKSLLWRCICDCGSEIVVETNALTNTLSCGHCKPGIRKRAKTKPNYRHHCNINFVDNPNEATDLTEGRRAEYNPKYQYEGRWKADVERYERRHEMICERCGCELKMGLGDLTRGQVVELLEQAVLDKKIDDIKLFRYEGSRGAWPFTKEEEAILRSYLPGFEAYESGVRRVIRTDSDQPPGKRKFVRKVRTKDRKMEEPPDLEEFGKSLRNFGRVSGITGREGLDLNDVTIGRDEYDQTPRDDPANF